MKEATPNPTKQELKERHSYYKSQVWEQINQLAQAVKEHGTIGSIDCGHVADMVYLNHELAHMINRLNNWRN